MRRIGTFVGIIAVVLILALIIPMAATPEPIGAQSNIYALVQVPATTNDNTLKQAVDEVFDATGCGGTAYAIIGCTQPQLDSLVASGYTVVEQRTGNEEECLDYLFGLRDELVSPGPDHHTILGPDGGGYYAIDSHERMGPHFNWQALTATKVVKANVEGSLDDGWWYPISIGFPFTFYGKTFTKCSIGTNGQLWFEDNYLGFSNSCIPSSTPYDVKNNFIAALWNDLDPNATNCQIYYKTLRDRSGRTIFVVEWYKIPHYYYLDEYANNTATFEVILYKGSNEILIQYQDVDFGDPNSERWGKSATVGIQKNPTTGLQYSCNKAELSNGLAILFTPKNWRYSPLLRAPSKTPGPPLGPR